MNNNKDIVQSPITHSYVNGIHMVTVTEEMFGLMLKKLGGQWPPPMTLNLPIYDQSGKEYIN